MSSLLKRLTNNLQKNNKNLAKRLFKGPTSRLFIPYSLSKSDLKKNRSSMMWFSKNSLKKKWFSKSCRNKSYPKRI